MRVSVISAAAVAAHFFSPPPSTLAHFLSLSLFLFLSLLANNNRIDSNIDENGVKIKINKNVSTKILIFPCFKYFIIEFMILFC